VRTAEGVETIWYFPAIKKGSAWYVVREMVPDDGGRVYLGNVVIANEKKTLERNKSRE